MAGRSLIPRAAAQRNVSSTSDTVTQTTEVTYTGIPDGMWVGIPPHEIPDTGARMIVDAFVHNPGLVDRRGPVTAVLGTGAGNLTYSASGLVSVVDPTGAVRVGALHGDASHGYLGVLSADFTTRIDLPLGVNLTTSPYQVVQIGARLKGGVYLSICDKFSQGAAQNLILWKGGAKAAYSTGSLTSTQGSKSVSATGSAWQANITAGMFVFANSQYIGCVKAVSSDGVLQLEDNALLTTSGVSYSIQPFRGINPRIAKGYITTDATTTTVNGAATKFQADGLAVGTWDIYKSADLTFVGTVSSVVSDIQLNFVSNSTLNLSQEAYTAIRRDGSYSNAPSIGAVTSIWAGRQTYANNSSVISTASQVWFSSVDDAEAIDTASLDGDFIQVPSVGPAGVATPIVAMSPTPSSLLILKESEAYALFGQSTSQFTVSPVSSDGTLSPMSVQPWNGLVVYAGRQGIYMFDGQEAVNITTDRLGWYYQESVKNFDTSKHRMWSMIARDHYLLFIEAVTPPVPKIKGSTSITQTAFTIAIHLPTQAVTVLENVNLRGSLALPSQLELDTWFVVNNASGAGVICAADTLFDSDGVDDFGSDGGNVGPDFYIETKKYSISDPLLKKLWKMLMLTYQVAGDSIRMDTVPGLNEIGTQSKTAFPATGMTWTQVANLGLLWAGSPTEFPTWASPVESQFITKRIRFLKRSQMMSFRLYQNSNLVRSLQLGPWAVVVKPQRVGRT